MSALLESHGFTNATLGWKAWLDTVQLDKTTAEQMAVLESSHPKAKVSDYYLLLVHQAEILDQRSTAFNAIMYAPGGLSRAERELASTVVSRVNGCVYCASVHARHAAVYGKREADVDRLLEKGVSADLGDERWNAIVAASVALTSIPIDFGPEEIDRLRKAGLDELAIVDVINAASFFNWANRLMLSLGEPALQK